MKYAETRLCCDLELQNTDLPGLHAPAPANSGAVLGPRAGVSSPSNPNGFAPYCARVKQTGLRTKGRMRFGKQTLAQHVGLDQKRVPLQRRGIGWERGRFPSKTKSRGPGY